MNTHTADPDHDREQRRAAMAARLGLDATPARPAAAPPAPTPQPQPQRSVLDALAATPATGSARAAMVRVDGDGRVALRELADELEWTAEPTDVTVLADRATRRLWVVPTPEPCGCGTCACGTVPSPSPAFATSELDGAVQSKRRLKLPRGLWSALAVEPGGDLVLAVAVDDGLLLASVDQLAAALLADIGTPTETTATDEPTATDPATTKTTPHRHLEVVA